ncbi:thioredoxin [Jannaschia sp. EhC01]|nr:thioredoxin [Jannaschia sp. EhC01]
MFLRSLMVAGALALSPLAAQAELNADGLHVAPWLMETFRDMREDLEEATANGQRLAIIIEQRGCIYCAEMYEEVFVVPEIEQLLTDDFFVVRLNMYGSTEVVDFDGEVMSESEVVRRWRVLFTPTILFFPEEVAADVTGIEAAVATIPGAFGRWTTLNMLNWVLEEGYDGDESFQQYHARLLATQLPNGE